MGEMFGQGCQLGVGGVGLSHEWLGMVIAIILMAHNLQGDYKVYQIGKKEHGFPIAQASLDSIFRGDHSYRKAIPCRHRPDESQKQFKDPNFNLTLTSDDINDLGNRLQTRRLYEIYDKEFNFLLPQHMEEIPLKRRKFYPTFLSEFSMIDKDYLCTLFFTKILNEKGFYRYFVRRNGQYHVEVMDDWIPVDPDNKLLPPWGLSEYEPWKILLMKAWIKEKGSIKAVFEAEPYEFIDAFGFPGYRAISIKKEIQYLNTTSRLQEKSKVKREKRIPLDIPGFVLVGKTRNSKQLEKIGLIPNRAGYRIFKTDQYLNKSMVKSNIKGSSLRIDDKSEDNIYRVQGSLPSAWVGEYSLFANGKIQQPSVNQLAAEIKSIENQFFASYFEISQVFSKFYICPEYSSDKLSGSLVQDSLSINVGQNPKPFYFLQLKVSSSGFLNLNIELPHDSAEYKKEGSSGSKRYSYIRYFMAKQQPKEKEQNLTGYDYYDGEYVKGYHKSLNRFITIDEGTYYVYFKIERNKNLGSHQNVAININSNASIQSFKRIDPRNPRVKFEFIMKSALHNYNMRYGLKSFVGNQDDESTKMSLAVYVSHSFDDNGFGLVSIVTKKNPKNMSLAMNVNQNIFRENRIDFAPEAHSLRENEEERIHNFSAKEGEANIAIFERTVRSRQIDEKFPPLESIDFFYIL